MSESYQKLFEEAVKSIPRRCKQMKRRMDRDLKEWYVGYPYRYRTYVEGVGNKKDCSTLADLVSKQFPIFGTSWDMTSEQNGYHCMIAVIPELPEAYDRDYKQKLMYDLNEMRVRSIGTYSTSLFIPDESKCRKLASDLSAMSSRPDCTAFVERGMCNIGCILRPHMD